MTDTNGARVPLPDVDVLFFDGFDELDSIGPWEVLSAAGLAGCCAASEPAPRVSPTQRMLDEKRVIGLRSRWWMSLLGRRL